MRLGCGGLPVAGLGVHHVSEHLSTMCLWTGEGERAAAPSRTTGVVQGSLKGEGERGVPQCPCLTT